MKPYVHAVFTRGKGFRCDDISDFDQFAARQAALAKALRKNDQPKGKLKFFVSQLKKIFRNK
jgi:hypothetical protein